MGNREVEMKLSQAADWPAKIKGWRVEQGEDASGHYAFWVWVTLSHPLDDRELRSKIRRLVRDRVAQLVEPDPEWVYVRFRGESELAIE